MVVNKDYIASLPDQSVLELAKGTQKGIVAVPDTTVALGDLAAHALSEFQGTVIAVTGSVGKTTCKGMVRSQQTFPTNLKLT